MPQPTWFLCRIFEIEAGHRLSKHEGRCHNVHGHRYEVEIRIKSNSLNVNDMVLDFSTFKAQIHSLIDGWDHAVAINTEDPDHESFLKVSKRVIPFIGCDPTAERMAHHFYKAVQAIVTHYMGIQMDSVCVWETSSSYAEYRED